MTRSTQLILHLGIPIVVGFIMGLNQVRLGQHLTLAMSVLFWTTISLGVWTIFEAVTRGVAVVLRPWMPGLLVVLLVAMPIASIPGRSFIYLMVDLFATLRIDGDVPPLPPPYSLSWPFFESHLRSWGGFFTFWGAANLVLVELLGFSRFGFAARKQVPSAMVETNGSPQETLPAKPLPRIVTRIPPQLGTDLLALCAQDHYLKVHTPYGSAMILYSLSEAIEELDSAGLQGLRIHRSHWVARAAVARVVSEGRGYLVHLTNGLELPVGPSYIALLRTAGFIAPRRSPRQPVLAQAPGFVPAVDR